MEINSTNEPLAYLIKIDGDYYVKHLDDTLSDPCKLTRDDGIALPKNDANRQWFSIKKAEATFVDDPLAEIPLTFKATRSLGTHIPNEKLISYLSDEDQAEYRAIIDRALAARAEARAAAKPVKTPLSDKDKLMAKIAKLQAALDALDADED